eukprot:GHVO01057193.1.p1 GENE.GHVO01057193.1~~GHVO01057193.1.p1  ORF type:complete len:440 (+),score=55.19 GHVO01057193.1:34-1320(+)
MCGPSRSMELQAMFMELLERVRREEIPTAPKCQKNLKLRMGGYMIPREDKRFRSGEDGWAVNESIGFMGVTDGVSAYGDPMWMEIGFNPKLLAEEILRGASIRIEEIRDLTKPETDLRHKTTRRIPDAENSYCVSADMDASLISLEAMACGYDFNKKAWGSTTCVIASIDKAGQKVGIANLGDSGALIMRRMKSTGSLDVVMETTSQQHSFNMPYQLECLPEPKDLKRIKGRLQSLQAYHDSRVEELEGTLFYRMLQPDKHSSSIPCVTEDIKRIQSRLDLLNASLQAYHQLQENRRYRIRLRIAPDKPQDADLYDSPVQEGDLIIMGSDGLFDNLFQSEITALCGLAVSPYESKVLRGHDRHATCPRDITKALSLAAYWRSINDHTETPFSEGCNEELKKANNPGRMSGGKEDDISVVCAWVVAEDD